MADIELVIKIPERMYTTICGREEYTCNPLELYIKNGTPLPKGHGRLIDADALKKVMLEREERFGDDRTMCESIVVEIALDMFTPTIIEADK